MLWVCREPKTLAKIHWMLRFGRLNRLRVRHEVGREASRRIVIDVVESLGFVVKFGRAWSQVEERSDLVGKLASVLMLESG